MGYNKNFKPTTEQLQAFWKSNHCDDHPEIALEPKVTKKEVKEVLGRKHMSGSDMAQYDIAVQRRNRPVIEAYENAYPGLKLRK
jgi:hypothetical protein